MAKASGHGWEVPVTCGSSAGHTVSSLAERPEAPEGTSLNSQELRLCNGRVKRRRGRADRLGTPRRTRLFVMDCHSLKPQLKTKLVGGTYR